jgi:hypothetical protein
MTADDWPALGPPSRTEALSAALKRGARDEASAVIASSAEFRDAARCIVPVLRLARTDQALIDAAATQALSLFKGGWVQNGQLPSLLFCLRVAGQQEWVACFCRRAVERARQVSDWSALEKTVEWFALAAAAEEAPHELGFSRESLEPIWNKLSPSAQARVCPAPGRIESAPPEAHAEFERGGVSGSSILEALAAAADTSETPTDQLRALAAKPLEEMRARVAAKARSLPEGSAERAEAERELARIIRAIKALP